MKIYSPDDYSHVVPLDCPAVHGQEFDVDDTVAAGLLEQGWTTKKPKPRSKTAADEPIVADGITGGTTTDAADEPQTEE